MKLFSEILYDREVSVAKTLYNENKDFVQTLPTKFKLALKLLLTSGRQSFRLIESIRKITRSSLNNTTRTQTFGKQVYEGEIML